jgi:ABC-type phosphate transport system auxiliary subunit
MPKQVELTRSEEMELVRVRKKFLELCRVLDKRARTRMLAERSRLVRRMQELGMERAEIAELSKDGGELDGIKVVTLDSGRREASRWVERAGITEPVATGKRG